MKKFFLVYLFSFLIFITNASAQCLSGTYTIGGVTPSYATITSAVSALTVNGVCGPVIFNIRSGTYNEQITIPAITGSSLVNTITFQSEAMDSTAVTLSFSAFSGANYTLRLNGADNLIFQKMTIKSLNINYGGVVFSTGDSDNNVFKNNEIVGISTTGTGSGMSLFYATSSDDDNNVYDGNRMVNGSYAIYQFGTSSVVTISGTVIKNNYFKDQYWTAVQLYYNDAPVVDQNIVINTLSTTGFQGIRVEHSVNGCSVQKNNLIAGSIIMNVCTGSVSNHFLVANNTISSNGTHCLIVQSSSYVDVLYNSTRLVGGVNCYPIFLFAPSNVTIQNNILFNELGTAAVFAQSGGTYVSDHNDLYSTGANLISDNGILYPTLYDWQISSAKDLNSLSVNPYYTSSSDLHSNDGLLNNEGLANVTVVDDMSGVARSASTPDIGAFEFAPFLNDAALLYYNGVVLSCDGGSIPINVELANAGSATLSSATIKWEMNGVPQTPFNWTGALNASDTTSVYLGNYTLVSGITHVLKSWVENPNGVADNFNLNDTIQQSTVCTIDGALTSYTSLTTPCLGPNTIQVKLKNVGSTIISNSTIGWQVNGIAQTPYSWTGSLNPNDSVIVSIGSYSLTYGTPYVFKTWIDLTNGGLETVHSNDTITSSNTYAHLNGTYTIGGTTPDYSTIALAVTALTNYGVCGPVVFNIRSGIYTEQITIPFIAGTSATNTITFQSEALDSMAVVVQAAGTVTNNFVFKLNGVDHCKFYKLKIKNTSIASSLYTCAFYILGNSDYVGISNCVFETAVSSTSANTRSQILAGSTDNENFVIKNSSFTGGSVGINMTCVAATANASKIINNYFQTQNFKAISLTNVNSPVITDNTFNYSTILNNYAVWLTSCNDSSVISGNNFIFAAGGSAISLTSCLGNTAKNFLISNNTVRGAGNVLGFNLATSQRILILHNTIIGSGTATTNYCFYISNPTSNVVVKNNIFYQTGAGMVYQSVIAGAFLPDYNDVFCAGATFGSYTSVGYANFAAWQAGTPADPNSLNNIPLFVSPTNLHVSADFSLNLVLPYFSQVATDIEGTVRDITSPYFGAYEYFNSPITEDVSLDAFTAPVALNCSGTYPIKVRLKNFGTNTLTSVDVNWKVNGVLQPVFSWTGSLLTSDTVSATIGNLLYSAGGSYALEAWTSNPNGLPDGFVTNDSSSTTTTTRMAGGTYTIGGVSPDFATFGAAVSALVTKGICGPVVFNFRNGTYNQQILINAIPGVSAINTVTFQSESGINTSVTLTNTITLNPYTIYLSAADYVEFKNLTLTNGSGTTIVWLESGSDHCSFTNNVFFGGYVNSCIKSGQSGYSPSSNYSRIINNTFQSSETALMFEGNVGIQTGTVISNNLFTDQGTRAMQLLFQDSTEISSNTITNFVPTVSNLPTILLYDFKTVWIVKNKISIHNSAIAMTNFVGVLHSAVVANNFIHITGSSFSFGMNLDQVDIYNNSINITNTNPISYGLSVGANTICKNNSIVNTGGGASVLVAAFSPDLFLNYNNLYTTGAVLAEKGTSTYPTLSSWTAGTTLDSNSVSVDPLYTSASDLHVYSVGLNNLGASLSGIITDDIDGQSRSLSTPDIGADEYTPLPLDASLFAFDSLAAVCSGTTPIRVKFLNSGTSNISSATIFWEVNGVMQPTNNWMGSLNTNDTASVLLGNYTLLPAVSYNIKAWVKNPNGTPDLLLFNDTVVKLNFRTALSGIYTIGGATPDYNTFTAATNDLILKGVCGPVTFNVRNGIYNEQISLPWINGSSALNSIVFKSESGDSSAVVLTFGPTTFATNYSVNFNSTAFITFKQMTLRSSGTGHSSVVTFAGSCSSVSLFNNILEGISGTPVSTFNSVIFSGSTHNNNLKIENNVIKNGSYGVHLSGISATQIDSGLQINNNNFTNQYFTGIYLKDQNAPIIVSNMITSNSTGSWKGFVCDDCSNALNFSENKVTNVSAPASNGIEITNSIAVSSTPGLISNNMVSTSSDAISIVGSSYQNVYFNSVLVNSPTGKCLFLSGTSNVNNINNIYRNSGGGYAIHASNLTDFSSSHHNDYSTSGANLANLAGANQANLSAWQAASSADVVSYSIVPSYFSPTNLHAYLDTALSNKGFAVASLGIYSDIDGENRDFINPDLGADELFNYSDVWPGETNGDSSVNNSDLLPIGLYYSQTGYPRTIVSNSWQGYPSYHWGTAQFNGTDLKHADCNGDGIIDANDTLAVNLNFSLFHSFAPLAIDERLVLPPIWFSTLSTTYLPGDWVNVDVMLGTATLPVEDLYGISFNINYDASLVQPGSESLNYPLSWLATPGIDGLKLSKIIPISNTACGVETRINQVNADGFGKIATFRFQALSTISSTTPMYFSYSGYAANDSAGANVLFSLETDTIYIVPLATALNDIENINGIDVYPNPYSGSTTIYYSLARNSNVAIEIYNTIGQKIETVVDAQQAAGEYKFTFSAKEKGYDAGVYFVKMTIDGVTTTKRIIEMK